MTATITLATIDYAVDYGDYSDYDPGGPVLAAGAYFSMIFDDFRQLTK